MLHTYAPPVHPVLKKFLLGHLTGSLSDGMVIAPMLKLAPPILPVLLELLPLGWVLLGPLHR